MKSEEKAIIPSHLNQLHDFVINTLGDRKAENVITINVSYKTEMTELIVIASGRSKKNVHSIAEHLHLELKHKLSFVNTIEGDPSTDWAVIDLGDIIVHIMHPEAREQIELEELWQR